MYQKLICKLQKIWSILLLLGLVTLFFSPLLFTSKIFAYRDFHHYFYPTRLFAASCIRDGQIPLWNPYLYSGIPFLANLQSHIFYPPAIIYYLLPFVFGLKLFVVSHFALAGLFMYLLGREFRLSKSASLVSAITYAFSGYLLSVVDMLTSLTSATWTPLIFLFFNKASGSGIRDQGSGISFKWIMLTGIALGLQFLGGEPTVLYLTLIALFLFATAKAVDRIQNLKDKLFSLQSSVFSLFLAGLIALGLTLFVALPFLEMVSYSSRGQMGYFQAVRLSLAPYGLIDLVVPLFTGALKTPVLWLGQSWLKSSYFGILPLLFLLTAILFYRRRLVLFWAAIFLTTIIFSFGEYFPLYKFLYSHLPGLSLIRYPIKFFCLVTFSAGILAGLGFEYIRKNHHRDTEDTEKNLISRRGHPQSGSHESGLSVPPWFLFILFSNLLLLAIFLLGHFNRETIFLFLQRNYFPEIPLARMSKIGGYYVEEVFANFRTGLAFLSLATLSLFLFLKKRISQSLLSFLILSIITLDLFIAGSNLNPLLDQEIYHKEPDIVQKVQGDRCLLAPRTESYFYSHQGETLLSYVLSAKSFLLPNAALGYRLFDAWGYGSLQLKDYTDLVEKGRENLSLISLLNVRHLISREKIPDLQLVHDEKGVKVYENRKALPRAFFVPEARIIKDREKILEVMLSKDFDPAREVLLEEEVHSPRSTVYSLRSAFRIPHSAFRILEYQPNRVTIQDFVAPSDGFLFLSDTYYPGWRAYVDGVQTKIYRANYTFRAIQIKEGRHRIEFIYRPLSFMIGGIGSIITLLILTGYGIWKKYLDGIKKIKYNRESFKIKWR